jgi:hypothetical protein
MLFIEKLSLDVLRDESLRKVTPSVGGLKRMKIDIVRWRSSKSKMRQQRAFYFGTWYILWARVDED